MSMINQETGAADFQKCLSQQPDEFWSPKAAAALQGLMHYWLSAEARDQLSQNTVGNFDLKQRPPLPQERGGCQIVLINPMDEDSGTVRWPMLRPAMLLPLIWRENDDVATAVHDDRLPPDVIRVANFVRQLIAAAEQLDPENESRRWSLHLADTTGEAFPSLKWMADMTADSGAVAVAGGLLTAIRGGKPKADVWASGGLDPGSGTVLNVDDVNRKIALAHEWDVTELFLPESLLAAAREYVKALPEKSLNVRPLRQGGNSGILWSLGRYRAALMIPPDETEDIKEHAEHFDALMRENLIDEADRHYRKSILPKLIPPLKERFVEQFHSNGGAGSLPDSLITIVSRSPDLIRLTTRVLGTKRCLLLYTDDCEWAAEIDQKAIQLELRASDADTSDEADELSEEARRLKDKAKKLREDSQETAQSMSSLRLELEAAPLNCDVTPAPFRTDQTDTRLPELVNLFSRDVAPESLLIDATPGKSEMKVVNALAAPTGSWLYFLDSQYIGDRNLLSIPEPGTQDPKLIRVRAHGDEVRETAATLTIDISLQNADLYAGCEIEDVNGRLNLQTPVATATEIIGRNIEKILDQATATRRDRVCLTGRMAVWAYLVIFHAVVHRFREVSYDDGSGPVVIARHG